MDRNDDTRMVARLQEWESVDRHSDRDRAMRLAAESHCRRSILSGDRPRLEDLAGEWIELFRTSNGKPVD